MINLETQIRRNQRTNSLLSLIIFVNGRWRHPGKDKVNPRVVVAEFRVHQNRIVYPLNVAVKKGFHRQPIKSPHWFLFTFVVFVFALVVLTYLMMTAVVVFVWEDNFHESSSVFSCHCYNSRVCIFIIGWPECFFTSNSFVFALFFTILVLFLLAVLPNSRAMVMVVSDMVVRLWRLVHDFLENNRLPFYLLTT